MASLRPMIRLARRQTPIHTPTTTTAAAAATAAPHPRRCFATASVRLSTARTVQRPAADTVNIVEVGPRDGLQNEKKLVSLPTKIKLIGDLAQAGLSYIEAGSFVSPKWVPQMDQSSDILESVLNATFESPSPTPLRFSFLAPNAKGFENAAALLHKHPGAWADSSRISNRGGVSGGVSGGGDNEKLPEIELAVFVAATESFSQKNLNCSVATSLDKARDVVQGAKQLGLRARAYVSVVLGCPFEGAYVDPGRVAEIAAALMDMGADEISLGDTTGMGTAPRTQALLRAVADAGIPPKAVAMHLHDTYGQALVNAAVSLEHGIRTFDSAVGGLGGCPFSPGATGNVATEDMVYFVESLGMKTGVDLESVARIGQWISGELGRPHASSVGKAVLAREKARAA
ncbi:hydroxymethylglutaryl-CoA lyase [Hypoxylon sp. NC1633]|nr:hydroxymethylglutaryl-CoA lyase [Hypoxylon sp. NC1633]